MILSVSRRTDIPAFYLDWFLRRLREGWLLEQISGDRLRVKKDPNQRPACGCAESVDVGCYDSCPYRCAYCYASGSRQTILQNLSRHDAASPLLTGAPGPLDRITERKMESCRVLQTSLFENAFEDA